MMTGTVPFESLQEKSFEWPKPSSMLLKALFVIMESVGNTIGMIR